MKIKINKSEIIQYLLAAAFILNLFVSEISNYKPYSFYLKGISSIILLLLTWTDYKFHNVKLVQTNQLNLRTFYTALFFFILIPALSLIYSHNSEFGIMKMGYLFISALPAIFVFLYFLITANINRIKNVFEYCAFCWPTVWCNLFTHFPLQSSDKLFFSNFKMEPCNCWEIFEFCIRNCITSSFSGYD